MLLGGKIPISGIDRTVNLDIPPETRNGRIFRLAKMGMPKMKHPDQRGDLFLIRHILLSTSATAIYRLHPGPHTRTESECHVRQVPDFRNRMALGKVFLRC